MLIHKMNNSGLALSRVSGFLLNPCDLKMYMKYHELVQNEKKKGLLYIWQSNRLHQVSPYTLHKVFDNSWLYTTTDVEDDSGNTVSNR